MFRAEFGSNMDTQKAAAALWKEPFS